MESVATFVWNRWQLWRGIGGRIHLESVAALAWNTQNASHVKNVPGRKTDPADARWLAKLMRYGLLQASFIPPIAQRDLRDLTRYRTKLVQERSHVATDI